jgi:predicted GNAT superfamily acetyltransferase
LSQETARHFGTEVASDTNGGGEAIEIRPLSTPADYEACVAMQREIWGADFTEIIPISVLKVVQQVGGIAAGAFAGSSHLAGFVFGISGVRGHRFAHWSDTLAVRSEFRDRGIGKRLKCYQRELLIEYGVERIHWTFDPLESRNAYLNFARLGITAHEYHRDFYGDTESQLHDGIGTDRLIARWDIQSDRVARRLSGELRSPTAAALADVPLINPYHTTELGPITEPDLALKDNRLRLAIPSDIQALKARWPAAAADWRTNTRRAFETYLGRGYVVTDVARDGDCSTYLFERATE